MAIDTAAKRKSTVAVTLLFLRMGVVPDGSDLSASQRLHTNGLYAGIAAAGSPTGGGTNTRITYRLIVQDGSDMEEVYL